MVVGGAQAAVLIDALGILIRESIGSRLAVLIDALGTSVRDSQGFGGGWSSSGGISCASDICWCSVTMLHS